MFDVRAEFGLRLPTTLHHLPYIIYEPYPLWTLGTFAVNDLPNNGGLPAPGEWFLSTEDLVYNHPQSIAVRFHPWATVFKTKPLRVKELRTHPSDRTSLCVRERGFNLRLVAHHSKQTKVRDAGLTITVYKDIGLETE